MSNYKKAKLGYEDISFDTDRNDGSFSRQTSDGGSQNIKKLNAKHIPVHGALSWGNATTVQEFLALCKTLRNEYDAFISALGPWENYLGVFADGATLAATYPEPDDDDFAWVDATKSFWHWDQALLPPAWADSYRTEGIKELAEPTELTLASGVVTQTQIWHKIDTEANGATDDMDKINRASGIRVLMLQLENSARVVTIKHAASGTDKFFLPNGWDIVMKPNAVYMFLWDDANDMWRYVGLPTIKDNFSFVGVPGINTDSTLGYAVSSRIYNGTDLYTCVDATAGAAVWFKPKNLGSVAIIKDIKATGTDGGASVNGRNTRDLNTIVSDVDSIIDTLAANAFRPIAGTYLIHVYSTSVTGSGAQIFVNDGTIDVAVGNSYNYFGGDSHCTGIFVADGLTDYTIEMFFESLGDPTGLGAAANSGEDECYTTVVLTRLGD